MSEDITRSVPFALERADHTSDGLTMAGYAAVFDSPTQIDSWEGRFTETIARGAFNDSLKARTPKLQFDHGRHPTVGSIPLGVIKRAVEDERGLYVEARLHDNWLVQPVRDAIASGAVDGMSFRFSVPDGGDTWNADRSQRTITRADVVEVGPVVWPAYPATTVGVRSTDLGYLFSLSDDERRALAQALVLGDADAVGAALQEAPATEAVGQVGTNPSVRRRRLALLNIKEH